MYGCAATGSTLVSQLVDSFIVLYIAFKIGNDWRLAKGAGHMPG